MTLGEVRLWQALRRLIERGLDDVSALSECQRAWDQLDREQLERVVKQLRTAEFIAEIHAPRGEHASNG